MPKVAKSFRLDPAAIEHLDELTKLTGSSQAAIIEQSLAIYRSLLVGGLSGPRRMLASTTPPTVKAEGVEPEPSGVARHKRPASQRLSDARGAARRSLSREAARSTPETPPESSSTTYRVRARGNIYEFPFPINEIPAKGSFICPCGSGKIFARCHSKEFQKAVKAGITQRG
jgi:hypothetical protein